MPIRWKVTAAFAGALLVVLTAVGAFVYLGLDAELSNTLDRGLKARADEVSAAVQRSPVGIDRADAPTFEPDENVAQVLRSDGALVAGTTAADFLLLDRSQLARTRHGPVFAERPGDARLDEAVRLLAVPVQARGERLVVVVGTIARREARSPGRPVAPRGGRTGGALLVSSAAGYLVAGLALRPVEVMRRQAEAITDQPDQRLPVPPIDDELGRLGGVCCRFS